MKFVFKSKED